MDPRGKPRPAYNVLKRFIRKFAREAAAGARGRADPVADARPPRRPSAADARAVRRAVATAAALLAAAALGGCGQQLEEINRGGRVAGTTLNVYSLLPEPGAGAARDMVDAEKLALYEARGTAGPFEVNFISIDEGPAGGRDGARASALAMREALADPQVIAVIGPAGSDTAPRDRAAAQRGRASSRSRRARATRASPTRVGPGEPERWQPSGRVTLARIIGDDADQAPGDRARRRRGDGPRRPAARGRAGARAGRRRARGRDARRRAPTSSRTPAAPTPSSTRARTPRTPRRSPTALAREHRGTPIVLPDALTRAGIADRLGPAARRRAVLVSSRSRARLHARAARASRPPSRSASAARPAPTPRSATRRCARCWPRSPPPATARAGARR